MFDSNDQGNTSRNDTAQQSQCEPQALRRELWLDLEDTIITPVVNGWADFDVINVELVRRVISSFNPHQINIFSFAIWDDHQRSLFERSCRPHVERLFGVSFGVVPTVDGDIIPVCKSEMGIHGHVDFSEASAFWSKHGAFRHWMRDRVKSLRFHQPDLRVHALLLDDAVYNETLRWPDLKATIEQRNIDQL